MNHSLGLIGGLLVVAMLAVGMSSPSADGQPANHKVTVAVAPPYAGTPAPQAPFDETPITPTETVGAARD